MTTKLKEGSEVVMSAPHGKIMALAGPDKDSCSQNSKKQQVLISRPTAAHPVEYVAIEILSLQ
jgi:hypothetical protein